jgi:hypothetical protein
MDKNAFSHSALGGIAIALGMIIAGICIGIALSDVRTPDRFVSVRGLAEREVDADLAIWPIMFNETSDDLTVLQSAVESKRKIITDFLVGTGFNASEISYSVPRITDMKAQAQSLRLAISGTRAENIPRYASETTVTLRSSNVSGVKKAMESAGTLVGKGVALSSENYRYPTEFMFTKLNQIKPEMIEEATKNAREAADKFAKDSGSKVGKIRNASQGLFSITDRDRNSPERKIIRVVTTVEYYLVDK